MRYFPLLVISIFLSLAPLFSAEKTKEAEGTEENVNRAEEQERKRDAALIPIEGEIDKFQVIFLRRSIERAREAGVQTIIFDINTFGGRVDAALQIATLIGSLDTIRTVAYIPAEPESLGVSWSAGALISFSCNELYMAPGTSIGAAAPVYQTSEGSKEAGEKTVSAVRAQMAALAEKNGYSKEVAVAMVDKDVTLIELREGEEIRFELKQTENTGREAAQENDQQEKDDKESAARKETVERRVISPRGKLLTLTAGEMKEYGISSGTVSTEESLLDRLEISAPLDISPTGADHAVGFLTSAAVTSMLLTIGLLALYLEISSPGFGVPGTVAILAFAIIFFSGGLLGTLGSLELILFLLGVALLVVEVFLIPGFGVAGISGLLLMSAGLILSRQSFVLPENEWQWDLFLQNLLVVFGTFAVSFILMGILMMFFPRIRLFQRLILSTTSAGTVGSSAVSISRVTGDDPSQSAKVQSSPSVRPMVGSKGKVKTKLRPAGKAAIEGEDYSVVTEGEWIDRGEEIEVIEVAGNRIVVEKERGGTDE